MGMCVYKSINRGCSGMRRKAGIGLFVPWFGVVGVKQQSHTRGQDLVPQLGKDKLWKRGGGSSQRGNSPPAALMGSQLKENLVSVSHLGSLLSQVFFFFFFFPPMMCEL